MLVSYLKQKNFAKKILVKIKIAFYPCGKPHLFSMTKYIFITGGVFSSLGKGLAAASLALLIERKGYSVGMIKLDPYLNIDPGTMSPFQHGEVFVTEDGAETDLDLGHYFRFTNASITKESNITAGQIYDTILKKERQGDYLGHTVQIIPHVTDEIKKRIQRASSQKQKDVDVLFVEIGGTVGDIESLPFLEAIRQFRLEHPNNCLNIHLTYVPYLAAAHELKTKPTQHSVQTLRSIGIFPELLICRSEHSLSEDIKAKIALFCSLSKQSVFEAKDVERSIYEIPLYLKDSNIDNSICKLLNLGQKESNTQDWKNMIDRIGKEKYSVTIGLVGKYVSHPDAYKSIYEALFHSGLNLNAKVKIKTFEADKIHDNTFLTEEFLSCDGILVPGGFGTRGWEGIVQCASYCRLKSKPYFGICLGMQALVVEAARNLAELKGANSTEMDPHTPYPVISLLSEMKERKNLGGTMRLGTFPCYLNKGSHVFKIYEQERIFERHRHRYEVNIDFKEKLENSGLTIAGMTRDPDLCEIVEYPNHPWMIGVQFHPEFLSKLLKPHPLFTSFLSHLLKRKGAL